MSIHDPTTWLQQIVAMRTGTRFRMAVRGLIVAMSVLAVCTNGLAQTKQEVEQRLATELIRLTMSRLSVDPLTIDGLDASILLAQEAVALDPDNLELWRLMLELSGIAERSDLQERALTRVLQLDPHNDVAALMRLSKVIDRYQTVEERIAAYDKLLSEENVKKLGAAVASRMALDAALLHRRQGDIDRFAQRLTQSVTLDPSNRSAAAIATGFFRMRMNDALGEGELLTNLMLADPTDLVTQLALARLLLENGAYKAADQVFRLAETNYRSMGQLPTNELLADLAIAQWANRDHDAALQTINVRQAESDTMMRNRARREKPNLSMLEASEIKAPEDPILGTVRAVIRGIQSPGDAGPAAEAVIQTYEKIIDAIHATENSNIQPAQVAGAYLEMAWLAVWLNVMLERVPEFVQAADAIEPVSDRAKNRFKGWLAFRGGDAEQALEILSPIASEDVMSRLGVALVHLHTGRTKDAARELLAVNRAQPGSLVGIWAANRLTEILGKRVPLSEQATKLEQLISSIPYSFFRFATEPTLALALRVSPQKLTFESYEPLIVNIEITNNSPFPLAIDREGPIRSKVALAPSLSAAHVPGLKDVRSIVVNIAHRLRLLPGEKIVVPVNLRNYAIGDVLNSLAVNGSILRITAVVNFSVVGGGVLRPSLLGSEVQAPLTRIDGQRLGPEWIHETVQLMNTPGAPGVLDRMAKLSLWMGPKPNEALSQDERTLVQTARRAFDDAFADLDPVAQAWLLCVMPRGGGDLAEGMQWALSMARKSDHRLVRLTYLLFHTSGPTDPMLDAARRSDDPVLRRIAEVVQADALRDMVRPER